MSAMTQTGLKRLVVAGGVGANAALRSQLLLGILLPVLAGLLAQAGSEGSELITLRAVVEERELPAVYGDDAEDPRRRRAGRPPCGTRWG